MFVFSFFSSKRLPLQVAADINNAGGKAFFKQVDVTDKAQVSLSNAVDKLFQGVEDFSMVQLMHIVQKITKNDIVVLDVLAFFGSMLESQPPFTNIIKAF